MSEEEPTYEYIKGVGWAPSNYETASIERFGWRIIVSTKPPADDDWFVALNPKSPISSALEFLAMQVSTEDMVKIEVGGNLAYYKKRGLMKYHEGMKLLTVRWERV